MRTRLFKRNANGIPIEWIVYIKDDNLYIEHGAVGFSHNATKIETNRELNAEMQSMIAAKRKIGYKELKDIYDCAPDIISDNNSLLLYLDTYLPKNNTDGSGNFIPMLCKTLDNNKPFENGTYMGSWKINGERCIITASVDNDLFGTIHLHYRSRQGEDWTNKLSYLDDFLVPCIDIDVLDMMIQEGIALDGELYIPGFTINEINSIIKNVNHKQHYNLQFWCYDICIEDTSALQRYETLEKYFSNYLKNFNTKESHLNNTNRFILLPQTFEINSFDKCVDVRDRYIDLGFEGIVIRKIDADYQFGGKRNLSMLKFKKILDGKFKIIDIIPTSEKQKDLGKFILQNDINDQQFDCVINATHDAQREYLANKEKYLSKYALVEYRERSGVNGVPFHAKIVKLID